MSSRTAIKGALGIAIAALVIYPLARAIGGVAQAMDEGFLLVYPELILHGRLPYRDFETVLSPGNFGLLAGVYAIFRPNIFFERWFGLALRLLMLFSIFALARRWNYLIAAGAMLLGGTLLACVDVAAFAWSSSLAFTLLSLVLLAGATMTWRVFASGFFAAIAVLCRFDFGPAILVTTLPAFITLPRSLKRVFVAGAAAGMLPLAYLALVIGPGPLVHDTIVFPMFHLGAGRYLPVALAVEYLHRLLWTACFATALNVGAAVLAHTAGRDRPRGALLLGAALFPVGAAHYALQRFDLAHVIVPAFVALTFLPLSIFALLQLSKWLISPLLAAAVALALTAICLQVALPELTHFFYENSREELMRLCGKGRAAAEEESSARRAVFIEHNGRWFCFAQQEIAAATEKVLRELSRSATPGQRLFVGPTDLRRTNYCDTFVYHMLPALRPATRYLEMTPMSANAPGSHLAADVQSADWLVLNRFWDSWNEPNASNNVGPEAPNEVVQREFDLWANYGTYFVFRNKRLRNSVMLPP